MRGEEEEGEEEGLWEMGRGGVATLVGKAVGGYIQRRGQEKGVSVVGGL